MQVKKGFFQLLEKTKTQFHPSLGLDKTLSSFLTVKLSTDEPCLKYEPDQSVVQLRAGKVTWKYNQEHNRV